MRRSYLNERRKHNGQVRHALVTCIISVLLLNPINAEMNPLKTITDNYHSVAIYIKCYSIDIDKGIIKYIIIIPDELIE
jgi:hypothetical protein